MVSIGQRAKTGIVLASALVAIALVVVAVFPAAWLKGLAERKLSEQFGRPVTIQAASRESRLSFEPVFRLSGISIPQAGWAGPGKLASIGTLRIRIAMLPALVGRMNPELLSADNVQLDLVRDADRRVNWRNGDAGDGDGARGISLTEIENVKATLRYRDAFQNRSMTLAVTMDPARGLVASGSGDIDGKAVQIAVKGPVKGRAETWPFEASIAGPAIDMRMKGSMAGPFNTRDMTLRMTARAQDLKLVDRVIEAGLFGTQPVELAANVRHKDNRWTVSDLAGTIGSSRLRGKLTVDKIEGRSKIQGDLRFIRLDFNDLSTDLGKEKARALLLAEGPKLVPNTRINIGKIKNTDGRLAIQIDEIVGSPGLQSMAGVLSMDHRLLVAKPFTLQLSRGVLEGEVRVDQRRGQPEPEVTIALDLRGSSIDALAGGGGQIDAPVDGRIRLKGTGSTIREVVGRSNGAIGMIAYDGVLPARLARLLGFDVGKGLFTGSGRQAILRCAAIRLEMRRGVGTASPTLVDTSESQTRGTGSVTFPEERIALTLTGAPKRNSVLRLPGSVSALGTIREPHILVPREVKSLGNTLKAVGRALTGNQGPEAVDADCAALRSRVLS